MASEEIRKKWGTIFMGEREASVEQLNALQEPLRREQRKKEETEDYMERVRARAVDRARQILGEAYTERQKVLDEAKAEIAARKRQAAEECAKLKAEGETVRQLAQAELEKAKEELEKAEKIREEAHEEGFQAGMDKAGVELQEFRAEMGQSLAAVMRGIERERKNILAAWREDLATMAQCAAQAGTGWLLQSEHEAILKALVFQALDLLENRSAVTMRVNPSDEASVSDMFRAARERAPELKQWVVTGDPNIEAGGIVAETPSGSVDLQRRNFREMVDGILCHLGLPELAADADGDAKLREIVEREVAHIASLTPEPEQLYVEPEPSPERAEESQPPVAEIPGEAEPAPEEMEVEPQEPEVEEFPERIEPEAADPTLAALEDELFSLDDEPALPQEPLEQLSAEAELPVEEQSEEIAGQEAAEAAQQQVLSSGAKLPGEENPPEEPDQQALAEGGFV